MRVKSSALFLFGRLAWKSLEIGNTNLFAHWIVDYRSWVPTDWNKPFQDSVPFIGWVEGHDGDRILGTVCDKELIALVVESERVGGCAIKIRLLRIDPDGFDDFTSVGR